MVFNQRPRWVNGLRMVEYTYPYTNHYIDEAGEPQSEIMWDLAEVVFEVLDERQYNLTADGVLHIEHKRIKRMMDKGDFDNAIALFYGGDA